MAPTVMLIEDDAKLAGMVGDFLRGNGLSVTVEGDGALAAQRILGEVPDAVVLDLGLPNVDGLEVCRRVRPSYDGPILVLTARGEPIDEVTGLELGADDYMSKPAHPRVLLARLRALLRRAGANGSGEPVEGDDAPPGSLQLGALRVDAGNRMVSWGGREVGLTTAEFDLLSLLALTPGRIVTRERMYRELRGIEFDGVDRSIDLRVSRVRRKLQRSGAPSDIVKTIRGVGYQLVANP